MDEVLLGTCSWNYDSWVGLVYSGRRRRSAEYLPEYAARYPTAEVDSWFYKDPSPAEVAEYLALTPATFRFTCKVAEGLTLTHHRDFGGAPVLEANRDFLSVERFKRYVEPLEPLLPRVEGLILEFEYLNQRKMPSAEAFRDALGAFLAAAPRGYPLAVEVRNRNYLDAAHFRLLREFGAIPVLSEKLYLPPVAEVYARHRDLLGGSAILRLLGGDRKEIEARTGGRWDALVAPQEGKEAIVDLSLDIVSRGGKIIINVNNHYEGSAPLTIESLERLFAARRRAAGD